MDLNRQVFRAPSIPKIGRRNVSSSVIRGALKPQIKLNRSTFSFIKPTKKEIDVEKIGKLSAEKNISVEATLGETNRILVEIQKQLALDFGYRITEEKKALAAERKKIAAQKVSDKEASIEKGGKGILGKTFDKVVAPFKSIFQKLIDFFSIILTGILLNTAFKWLSNKENRKKLKQFFDFIKEYWQELLIIFAAYKLARLVGKIFNIAKNIKNFLGGFKKILDMLKKSPQGLCNCAKPSSPDDCLPVKDCIESLIKDPTKGPGFLNNLANALLSNVLFKNGLIKLNQKPISKPVGPTSIPTGKPPSIPIRPSTPKPQTPWYNTPLAQGLGYGALGLGLGALATIALVSPFEGPVGEYAAGSATVGAFGRAGQAFRMLRGGGRNIPKTGLPRTVKPNTFQMPNMKGLAYREFNSLNKLNPSQSSLKSEVSTLLRQVENSSLPVSGQARLNAIRQFADKKGFGDISRQLKELGIQSIDEMKSASVKRSRGGTIPGLSQGGTVGGRGSGLVDTIPAMLAAGEEVIRTSMAMMWRPLLKDINDNGAKLWMSFQRGTLKQDLNNKINYELNVKLMGLLKELLEIVNIDTKRIQKNKNKGGAGGSGGGSGGGWMGDSNMVNPFRNPKQWYNLGRNARIPNESTASWKQLIKDDFQQVGKFKTPTGYKGFNPLWSFTKGLGTGPTPIQRQLVERSLRSLPKLMKFGGAAAGTLMDMAFPEPALNPTLDDARRMGLMKYERNLQRPKRQAKVNVINLPPETMSVGPKPGSLKLPSSGEATTVPTISSFDSSNPYIAFTPDEYGMVM